MLSQNNGLIKRKLYKEGLVKLTESDHYGNHHINAMFSGDYWDSHTPCPWMIVNFLVPVCIYAYSFNVTSYIDGIDRYIQSWSIFDSEGVEIDRYEDDQSFASTQYKAFTLRKRLTTNYLKIYFNKSAYCNLAYIYYFDVFGSIVLKTGMRSNQFCSFSYIYILQMIICS